MKGPYRGSSRNFARVELKQRNSANTFVLEKYLQVQYQLNFSDQDISYKVVSQARLALKGRRMC